MRFEARAFLLGVAVTVAASAWAQVTTSGPIRAKPPKALARHVATFRGAVIRADAAQIIVRSRSDSRFVRTFTYSPQARRQVEKVLERGGFRYGDRVRIRYQAGTDVALAIRGKPSKHRLPVRSSGSIGGPGGPGQPGLNTGPL